MAAASWNGATLAPVDSRAVARVSQVCPRARRAAGLETVRCMSSCEHLDQVRITELPDTVAGCEDCLRTGDHWVHLRMCHTCGHIGCCDSSPNRHATAHHRTTGHPLIRSAESGEDWSYCYVEDVTLLLHAAGGR